MEEIRVGGGGGGWEWGSGTCRVIDVAADGIKTVSLARESSRFKLLGCLVFERMKRSIIFQGSVGLG